MPNLPTDPADNSAIFDLAPVSLWLEDYSGLKALFDEWRAPASAIPAFLAANQDRAARNECASSRSTARRSACSKPPTCPNSSTISGSSCATRCSRPTSRNSCSSGAAQSSPARPSTTPCPAGGSTFSSRAASCRATSRLGARAGRDRRRQRTRNCAATPVRQRDICARAVRSFAGVALGRGFQLHQAARRRGPRSAASPTSASSPTSIRNSSHAA